MKRNRKKHVILTALLIFCVFVSGCGCGKKEKDPAKEQVLKITITPAPTPTPEPEELDPDAIVISSGITMVNGYKADVSITGKQVAAVDVTSQEELPADGEETAEEDMQEDTSEE